MPKSIERRSSAASAETQSYLSRLQFDPRLLGSVVAKYITNIRLVILLTLTIILLGIMSYLNLPKRLNPEVKIAIVSVATVLPGASPEDVESLVTIPLEDRLRGLKNVDTETSISRENISFISIQFLSGTDPDKAKDDVQAAVDSVGGLPAAAQRPQVTKLDFEDQPIWTFVVTTKQDVPALMNFSEQLKRKLDDLPKVDRVVTTGFETQEIVITVSSEKVAQYGINPLSLSQSIRQAIGSYPAGAVATIQNSFAVTIDPSVSSIDELRQVRVTLQGQTFRLGEIASIVMRSKIDQPQTYFATADSSAQRAVTFYVYKSSSANIDEAGASVKQLVEGELHSVGDKFTLTTLLNTSEDISKQFTDLLGEFRTTMILVFACLFLFLGLRQAIISSLTVPLTFLSAFFFMRFFGMTINFLSLFAFLLALGLLVDDTIVTVSAMTSYYRTGKFSVKETGLLVWRDTIVPIWSTTITTIWSFVPLLLSTGIIGEFIKPIPIVVTITMLSSTAIAVLITLPLMMVILKPNIPTRLTMLLKVLTIAIAGIAICWFAGLQPLLPVIAICYVILLLVARRVGSTVWRTIATRFRASAPVRRVSPVIARYTDHGVINVDGFSHWYQRTIDNILKSKSSRRKAIAAVVIYAIFSFALLPLGFVKNEFFPKSDQNEIFVTLEMPSGTTLSQTMVRGQAILDQLRSTPETEFVTAELGRSSNTNSGGSADSNNAVFFSLRLKPKEERHVSSIKIAEELREKFTSYSDGRLSVIEESGGPPAGSDLQIQLLGDDLGQLDHYADQIVTYLKEQPGTTNVDKSVKLGTSRLTFVPDLTKLSQAGVTADNLGFWLRTYASGFPLDSVQFDKSTRDSTDIVFKVQNDRPTPNGLSEVMVTSPTGVSYPLLSLGQMVTKTNPTTITRTDGKRTISVSAALKSGYVATVESKKLEEFADSLKLPNGYSWKTGGANEENTKSVNSILQAMVVSAILILITMVIQFGSFRQAVIVLIVIPLAVSSVFLAFALTGTPLSFPALIGVLSLFGIVVTNSMFIVDKINLNRKQGMEFRHAISEAGASRMEPIILTKLCTVLGLLPITLADPLWRGLGGAIISGLLVSSTIMLLFIPVLYYTWMGGDQASTDAK